MTNRAVVRYREILSNLLFLRELKGELPQETEDQFTDALDRYWRAMTPAEQMDMELFFADRDPVIQAQPSAIDQQISRGAQIAPRRIAA